MTHLFTYLTLTSIFVLQHLICYAQTQDSEYTMIYNDSIVIKESTKISDNIQFKDSLLVDSNNIQIKYDIFKDLFTKSDSTGTVSITMPEKLNSIIELYKIKNSQEKRFIGYRIQIHSVSTYGSDIKQLQQLRDSFEVYFQTIPAYLKYINPDFKIRVGNYHSRLECIPDLTKIQEKFPSSYPVREYIEFDELKRIPMQEIIQRDSIMRDSIIKQ